MHAHNGSPLDSSSRSRISIAELSGASMPSSSLLPDKALGSLPARPAPNTDEIHDNSDQHRYGASALETDTMQGRRSPVSTITSSSSPRKRSNSGPLISDPGDGQLAVPLPVLTQGVLGERARFTANGSPIMTTATSHALGSPTLSHDSQSPHPFKMRRLANTEVGAIVAPASQPTSPTSSYKCLGQESYASPSSNLARSIGVGAPQTTSGKQYSFTVRQQPVHARMCGFGEKDRRPIDPPPILECVCLNYPSEQADQGSQPRPTRVKDPYLSVHVMLLDETGREECGLILSSSSRKQSERHGQPSSPEAGRTSPPAHRTASTQKVTRVLMGSLVTNSIQLEDDQGVEGSFFIFPDLSVRTEGRYTLKFTLFSLEGLSLAAASGTRANCIAEAVSEPFTVYTAKKFPGMLRSTELTKAFARQGYKVQVRNDIRARRSTHLASAGEDQQDEEMEQANNSPASVVPVEQLLDSKKPASGLRP